jgi:ABC-type lipoprotein release transport system permease subunit
VIGLALSSIFGGRHSRVRAAAIVTGLAAAQLLLLTSASLPGALDRGDSRANRRDNPETRTVPQHAVSALLWLPHQVSLAGRPCSIIVASSLGSATARPLGITKPIRSGDVIASPWLRSFLASPAGEQYRGRFPGQLVGTLNYKALGSPNECAVVIGAAAPLLKRAQAPEVSVFAAPPKRITPERIAVIFGAACAIGFPVILFTLACARIGTTRRTARYAGLLLVGATPSQLRRIAAIEWLVLGTAGSVGGTLLALGVSDSLDTLSLGSYSFFTADFVLSPPMLMILSLALPLVSFLAGVASLGRVIASPLAVSRSTASHRPSRRRLLALLMPLTTIAVTALLSGHASPAARLLGVGLALLALMLSLTILGPLLTRSFATVAARSGSVAAFLAGFRARNDAVRTFRPVAAVTAFVAVVIAIGSVADHSTTADTSKSGLLTAVLDDSGGLSEAASAIAALGNTPLASLSGWHTDSLRAQRLAATTGCDALKRLLGHGGTSPANCTGGYVAADSALKVGSRISVSVGNDSDHQELRLKVVGRLPLTLAQTGGAVAVVSRSTLPRQIAQQATLHAIVLPVASRSAYERLAGLIDTQDPSAVVASGAYNDDPTGSRERTFSTIAEFILALVLIVACGSLLVALADSLDERKAAFTRLLAIGAPTRVLQWALMIETAMPLVLMAAFAAATGLVTAALLARSAQLRFQLPPRNLGTVVAVLACAVAVAAVAASIGVWRGVRVEALREE